MALDAINNAMGVQATGYVPTKATGAVADNETEVALENVNASDKIDATTQIVENSEAKGDANYDRTQQQPTTSNEQLKKAIEQFNSSAGSSEAVYGIHEGTNRVTIKIVDKDTKKVIKELPPEKTLDMIARVWEMAGILVDEKR